VQFPLLGISIALAVSLARGGRFRHATEHELLWLPALIAGLAAQTGLDALASRGLVGLTGTVALLVVSEAAVLSFCIRNWYRPGMVLVGLGFTANALVILANGGMPVAPEAIAAIGGDPVLAETVVVGKHHLLTDATALPWLADVIPLPPLKLVISIGDIVLVAGMIPLTHHLMTPAGAEARLGRRSVRRASAPGTAGVPPRPGRSRSAAAPPGPAARPRRRPEGQDRGASAAGDRGRTPTG
jgi:hypothetical protein